MLVHPNGNGVGMRRFLGAEEGTSSSRMDGKGEILRRGRREKGVEVGSVGPYPATQSSVHSILWLATPRDARFSCALSCSSSLAYKLGIRHAFGGDFVRSVIFSAAALTLFLSLPFNFHHHLFFTYLLSLAYTSFSTLLPSQRQPFLGPRGFVVGSPLPASPPSSNSPLVVKRGLNFL